MRLNVCVPDNGTADVGLFTAGCPILTPNKLSIRGISLEANYSSVFNSLAKGPVTNYARDRGDRNRTRLSRLALQRHDHFTKMAIYDFIHLLT
jgi:hypothetical protein